MPFNVWQSRRCRGQLRGHFRSASLLFHQTKGASRIGKNLIKKLPEGFAASHEIFYAMLLHEQRANNYKPKWAAAQFKTKCDVWAPLYWNEFASVPPSKRVKNWITSRRIAYAAVQRKLKAQAAERASG